jgi:peptidoglycan/xylan/chitin deacetylase (PgdA/CDA1 family)
MNGIFTISLDFELHWGGFEKWPVEKYNTYFSNTRNIIPQMLSRFAENEIHVTWATVGMLFNASKKDLYQNNPVHLPTYDREDLSAYHYINHHGIGEDEQSDPYHYAPSLVRQIIDTPYQELGTHTYAHYYCNEKGQTLEQFRSDMRAAQAVAQKFGKKLQSLVFPRNQFNEQYLRICFEEGITSVRSNPLDWFWHIESTQQESVWKRLNRGLDAYLPIGKKNTFSIESLVRNEGLPICIPASRLLRPYNPKEFFLNDLKIQRIKSEMTRAARHGEVYHLWWHPHNFGNFPAESIIALQQILDHYRRCQEQFGMQSLTMSEIVSLLNHGK